MDSRKQEAVKINPGIGGFVMNLKESVESLEDRVSQLEDRLGRFLMPTREEKAPLAEPHAQSGLGSDLENAVHRLWDANRRLQEISERLDV